MKTQYWIVIIAIIFALFFLRECNNQSNIDNLIKDASTYSDSAKFEHLKNGMLVSTNTSLVLTSDQQVRDLASKDDITKEMIKKFKSLSSSTQIINNFSAKNDTFKFETKIPCDFKPFPINRMSKDYMLFGTISKNDFVIDELTIIDTMRIVSGRKKQGFLKRPAYSLDITHSNSLMQTSNIADYRYVPEKKWYERTWFHLLVGAGLEQAFEFGINQIQKK